MPTLNGVRGPEVIEPFFLLLPDAIGICGPEEQDCACLIVCSRFFRERIVPRIG